MQVLNTNQKSPGWKIIPETNRLWHRNPESPNFTRHPAKNKEKPTTLFCKRNIDYWLMFLHKTHKNKRTQVRRGFYQNNLRLVRQNLKSLNSRNRSTSLQNSSFSPKTMVILSGSCCDFMGTWESSPFGDSWWPQRRRFRIGPGKRACRDDRKLPFVLALPCWNRSTSPGWFEAGLDWTGGICAPYTFL